MAHWRFEVFDVLDSTSSYCARALEACGKGRFAVLARTQTQARGTKGRSWSGSKSNLAFSFACCSATKTFSSQYLPAMPYMAAVASVEGVEDYITKNLSSDALKAFRKALSLKWPNDLLLDGKKFGGVLVETSLSSDKQSMVVGIGLNLGEAPEVVGREVGCLADIIGSAIPPEAVARAILKAWDKLYALLVNEGMKVIFAKWQEYGCPIGTPLEVTNEKGCLSGVFKGLDENGGLILESSDGKVSHIHAGEVG